MRAILRDIGVGAAILCVVSLTVTALYLNQQNKAAAAEHRADEEVRARILNYVVKRNPEATIRDFADFPDVLLGESRRAGIDFRVIMAVIDHESEFNPRAIGKSGEVGLMQVLPSTGALVAKAIGIPFTPPKGKDLGTLGDPRLNIRIGIRYLKDAVDQFGGVNPTALRAYNRGSATALEHRPSDLYAERVAVRYMMVSLAVRS